MLGEKTYRTVRGFQGAVSHLYSKRTAQALYRHLKPKSGVLQVNIEELAKNFVEYPSLDAVQEISKVAIIPTGGGRVLIKRVNTCYIEEVV